MDLADGRHREGGGERTLAEVRVGAAWLDVDDDVDARERVVVHALDGEASAVESSRARVAAAATNEAQSVKTDPLSDYPRRNH